MPATGTLPRIIQLQDGSYATPDGKGGWAPYSGALPGGGSAAGKDDSFKIGDSEAINHAWNIVSNIDSARDLSSKPLATGTMAASITGIPVIGGIVGQNRANLQTKLGSVAGDLRQLGIRTLYQQTGQKGVGSIARNQAEQQALQNSLAAIGNVDTGGHTAPGGAQPDAATLNEGLGAARNIYLRHLARLYGMSPDDPNALSMLDTASKDPKVRANLLMQTQQRSTAAPAGSADHGITASAPPPAISGTSSSAGVSTDSQATVDPNVARIKPQLEQMLAADPHDISNDQILKYVHNNGVDLSIFGGTLNDALRFRMSREGAAWRANPHGAGNYTVDPHYNKPITGLRKTMAEVSGAAPGGVPVGATAVGAADTATLGAIPDIAGIVHGVTGAGPTRSDVIAGRDVSADEHPYGSFVGNMGGALLSPLGRGGGLGRTALTSAGYGFFGSDDPSLGSRVINAGLSGALGAAAHGVTAGALNGVRPAYRAGRNMILSPIVDSEELATDNALSRAANSMPRQDLQDATARFHQLSSRGAEPPAAAVLSRAGQDYLGTLAAGSPAAKTAATEIAGANRQALPKSIADDFNSAIRDATPANGLEKDMLNKPVREIASDVQDMASREYEVGMRPIGAEPLKVTPELGDVFTHERVGGAIRDALSNHQLDEATRAELRGLPGQLKALGTVVPGGNAATQAGIRAKYAAGIPLTVSGARNIATALDRTAAKLQEGSEGGVELRRLSKEIRSAIGEQYPEFAPINERYASRMRAIDVLDETRSNFLGETPEQIDALANISRNLSDTPNEPEFKGVPGAEPNGSVLPSNRQFGIAGAREAASTKAGAGTGEGGTRVAEELATGPNQQTRSAMVLGPQGAAKLAERAGAKAQVSDVLNRIASGPSGDQTAKWYSLAKRAIMYKLTGGTAHYAAAYALSGIPGMTANDAARVVRVYMDTSSADQAFHSLSKAYGAQRARTIMARMVGVASGAATQHQTPIGSPTGAK
jgi:hypothetical protein